MKIHLKMLSVKLRPFCPGGDELMIPKPGVYFCLVELKPITHYIGPKQNIKFWHYWPFVRGINWWLVDSPHNGSVMRKLSRGLAKSWSSPLDFSFHAYYNTDGDGVGVGDIGCCVGVKLYLHDWVQSNNTHNVLLNCCHISQSVQHWFR